MSPWTGDIFPFLHVFYFFVVVTYCFLCIGLSSLLLIPRYLTYWHTNVNGNFFLSWFIICIWKNHGFLCTSILLKSNKSWEPVVIGSLPQNRIHGMYWMWEETLEQRQREADTGEGCGDEIFYALNLTIRIFINHSA